MRTVLIAVLLLTACSKEEYESAQTTVDIEVVVAKAEFDRDRVHLPGLLEDADNNPKKLAHVYTEAVRLKHDGVRQEADRRLMEIFLPRAEAATWSGTPRRLKRKVPEGSQTWQRLDAIERELLQNDPQ